MAMQGEIKPMPDAAIFADTQDEPGSVYDWLEFLIQTLPFPVHVVSKGQLSAAATTMRLSKHGKKYSKTDIPFFTLDAADGSRGKIRFRSCTADYKIVPIIKKQREIAGIKRGETDVRVFAWIGISTDEIRRIKPSKEPWSENRFPLVEKRMSRFDCLRWMADQGYPEPPRSACVYCPYHSNEEWRRLQKDEPQSFELAVEFEKSVQKAKENSDNFRSQPFLHKSCQPLGEVDFRSDVERGQKLLAGWEDECEGMCGL